MTKKITKFETIDKSINALLLLQNIRVEISDYALISPKRRFRICKNIKYIANIFSSLHFISSKTKHQERKRKLITKKKKERES